MIVIPINPIPYKKKMNIYFLASYKIKKSLSMIKRFSSSLPSTTPEDEYVLDPSSVEKFYNDNLPADKSKPDTFVIIVTKINNNGNVLRLNGLLKSLISLAPSLKSRVTSSVPPTIRILMIDHFDKVPYPTFIDVSTFDLLKKALNSIKDSLALVKEYDKKMKRGLNNRSIARLTQLELAYVQHYNEVQPNNDLTNKLINNDNIEISFKYCIQNYLKELSTWNIETRMFNKSDTYTPQDSYINCTFEEFNTYKNRKKGDQDESINADTTTSPAVAEESPILDTASMIPSSGSIENQTSIKPLNNVTQNDTKDIQK